MKSKILVSILAIFSLSAVTVADAGAADYEWVGASAGLFDASAPVPVAAAGAPFGAGAAGAGGVPFGAGPAPAGVPFGAGAAPAPGAVYGGSNPNQTSVAPILHAGFANLDSNDGADFRTAWGGELMVARINGKLLAAPLAVVLFSGKASASPLVGMVRVGASSGAGVVYGADMLIPLSLLADSADGKTAVRIGYTAFGKAIGGAKDLFEIGLQFKL